MPDAVTDDSYLVDHAVESAMSFTTEIGSRSNPVERFFAYARERHAVYLRRQGVLPMSGGFLIGGWIKSGDYWTLDPIMQKYRFTNVFRELDRTTTWFRENVREPLRDMPAVIPATVLFRWFNRITTGETLFFDPDSEFFDPDSRMFTDWLRTGKTAAMERALRRQGPPWVTGAYIINTHGLGDGEDKLRGVMLSVQAWMKAHRGWASGEMPSTLEEAWWWVQGSPGMGPFMAYEVVSDLRWTTHLSRAPDILTWANPGPGARRGALRVQGVAIVRRSAISYEGAQKTMAEILKLSRDQKYWPQGGKATAKMATAALQWPRWEMRDVEHTLCEFDKYERCRLGQGRPRGRFP